MRNCSSSSHWPSAARLQSSASANLGIPPLPSSTCSSPWRTQRMRILSANHTALMLHEPYSWCMGEPVKALSCATPQGPQAYAAYPRPLAEHKQLHASRCSRLLAVRAQRGSYSWRMEPVRPPWSFAREGSSRCNFLRPVRVRYASFPQHCSHYQRGDRASGRVSSTLSCRSCAASASVPSKQ